VSDRVRLLGPHGAPGHNRPGVSKVLLVDDDIAEISSVKRALLRAGHQPALATNASDAVAAIAYERPDLLIVSTACENGEALGLARRLPSDAATAGIPILLIGDVDPMPEGARRLPRPLDPEQLMAELTAALGRPGGIELESPDAPRPARAPAAKTRAGTPVAKVSPDRAAPPLVQAADAAAARARAAAKAASAAREPPASATSLAAPLPGPGDTAVSRRAAADALRARAEELRKGGTRTATAPASPAPDPAPAARTVAAKPAAAKQAPAKPAPAKPAAAKPAPKRGSTPSLAEALDLDEGALEAALHRADMAKSRDGARAAEGRDDGRHQAAEDALRALEEEASSHAAEVARARRTAGGSPAAQRGEDGSVDEAMQAMRREAFEEAKRELEEQARKEAAEAARLVQAEARAGREAVANAQRETQELARARAEAEERARAEADARRAAEEQLQTLRQLLEEERRKAEERVASVMERAAQEEEAADELRRMAEDEVRRRDEETARTRAVEEEKLKEAIASASAEMETLRRRSEEETLRREEAESALHRIEKAQRRAAERDVDALARLPLGAETASFTPPPLFSPFDGDGAAADPPEPGEDTAWPRAAAQRTAPADPDGDPDLRSSELDAEPTEPAPEPSRSFPAPPAPLRAGELAELPIPRLLAMAARARLGGRLDFQGEVARSIWFEEGRVVGAASADPSDRVEEVALRLGLITREQHRQIAQATASLSSRRAALLLLERGFLKTTELTGLVRRRTEEVLFGVFGEERARFRWTGAEVPPEERAALERGALALAVEGVRRRWRGARVEALLGGSATLLAPVQGAPGAAELGLSADERRVVALADGLRALDEIIHASPLDALTTRQVLAAMVATGALSVRVLHAGQPRGQAAASIDLARVKEKLEQVRRADYFTVLGVSRLCTPHEVREAADRLAAEFEPRRFEGSADEGLPGRLGEILQVIQDAREVLADDRLREEYLRGLGDAG
jgi:CheY-like chemotaxis protein